jgi:uncharacterized protein (TIGR02757 family)
LPRFRVSKDVLERAYQLFHQKFYRDHDPVGLVHRYATMADQEVVGFIVALLSYGNVKSIRASAEKILSALGPAPADRISLLQWPSELDGFYHRFNRAEDIRVLLYWMGKVLEQYGTLEAGFRSASPETAPMRDRIAAFVRLLTHTPLPDELENIRQQRARNLKYLLSNPEEGAACKRVNMYLRWMIRPADGIDLGAWQQVSCRDLVLPVDTHVLKTIRKLDWTRSKSANWKVAEEATVKLRKFCPEDPIRYDFSLCHLGMHGHDIAKI